MSEKKLTSFFAAANKPLVPLHTVPNPAPKNNMMEVEGQKPAEKEKSKVKSGRKPKTFAEAKLAYLSDPKYSKWLREEEAIQDGVKKTMFYCDWCRRRNEANILSSGLLFGIDEIIDPLFHLTRLEEHETQNKKHKQAKAIILENKLLVPKPVLLVEKNDDYVKLYNLLEFLVMFVDKNIAVNSTIDIIKLIKKHDVLLPENYLCFNSIKELIVTMSLEMKAIIVEEMRHSDYFSIAIDSSTDISKTKSLAVNFLYLKNQRPHWVYFDSLFLKDYEAKTIHKALVAMFNEHNIDYKSKLIGYASDGDRAFRSEKNGVNGLLRKDQPRLIGIHCLAHVFTLVHKTDLSKQYPILDNIFELAYDTYKYIYDSPSRIEALFENEEEFLDLTSGLNLLKPIPVRWLSMFNSIVRITQLLKPICQTLKEQTNLTAKSLLNWYENPRYLCWLFFLSDIAPEIKVITTVFQEKDFSISRALGLLKNLKANLTRKYIESFAPGYCYDVFRKKFDRLPNDQNEQNDTYFYDNFLVFSSKPDLETYHSEFKEFSQSFVKNIDKRFKELYLLEAFEFFDIELLRQKFQKEENIIQDFQDKIPVLLKHLKLEHLAQSLCGEFPYLVNHLKLNTSVDDKAESIYRELLIYYKQHLPWTLNLMSIYKVLPLSTVECERTFSAQNRTKTKFRAMIGETLLPALLHLSINAEEAKENYFLRRSIIRWREAKKRYFLQPIGPSEDL